MLGKSRRYRPLIAPHLLGFRPPARPGRKARKQIDEQQARDLALTRAYLCGARYSCWGWRRRAPPRFACGPRSSPDFDLLMECGRAFYRGYDAATRARITHQQQWAAGPLSPLLTPPPPAPAACEG